MPEGPFVLPSQCCPMERASVSGEGPRGNAVAWPGGVPVPPPVTQSPAALCPCSDLRVDSQKQRHPSGGVAVASEMVLELEGVELGADGKVRARGLAGVRETPGHHSPT